MAAEKKWTPPPRIEELYKSTDGNNFSSINRPTAGPRSDSLLQRGSATLQLYSLATPNGAKVGILLEELGVAYDAHVVNIGAGDQFTAGFVGANPNSKIPALIDHDGPSHEPLAIMESLAIMLYLCEKYPEKEFLPTDVRLRSECMQWIFFQGAGQGPMTGNYGHFMVYAPPNKLETRDYGVARYGMEVQKYCDVLDRHLAGYGDFRGNAGMRTEGARSFWWNNYTVADMALFPWARMLRTKGYDRPGQPRTQDFLGFEKYKHLNAWIDRIEARAAVQRGLRVCAGSPKPWLAQEQPQTSRL